MKPGSSSTQPASWNMQMFLFVAGVFVFGTGGIFSRLSIHYNGPGKMPNPSSVFMLSESGKLLVSLVMFCHEKGLRDAASTLRNSQAKNMLRYLLPGVIYLIFNIITSYKALEIDAATNALFRNIKIITTAIAFRLVFRKQFTNQKLCAIGLLFLGCCTATLGADDSRHKEVTRFITPLGVIYSLTNASISAVAGVYYEWLMKRGPEAKSSIHLQNIYLYFWGVVLNSSMITSLMTEESDGNWLQYFNMYTYIKLIFSICTGLLVSQIMRRMNNVSKLFISAMATMYLSILSSYIWSLYLSWAFWTAAALVCFSLILHKSPPMLCFKEKGQTVKKIKIDLNDLVKEEGKSDSNAHSKAVETWRMSGRSVK